MIDKQEVYIMGDYRSGAADGLLEFNYQTVQLLKNDFLFHFVEFDDQQDILYYEEKYVDDFSITRFGTKGLSQFKLSPVFCEWLVKIDANNIVFHLSHIYNFTNFLEARLFQKLRIPYIVTPHDSFVYRPTYKADRSLLKRWYRTFFVKMFDKYVLDNAVLVHGITAQCPPSLEHITRSPVSVVTNQVRDMHIRFDQPSIEPQICFIGRSNIFTKGIDLALTAFHLFKMAEKDSADMRFKLVGPADERAINTVQDICRNLGLAIGKDVILTGKIPESERNSILSRSKIYLQLSRSEGFGLSIVQALSCYKPVVISNEVPIHDKITLHKAGYVVNSPEEAAQAIAEINALSETDYAKMAMNARRCYEQEFHPSVIKPQLINLYKKALTGVNT